MPADEGVLDAIAVRQGTDKGSAAVGALTPKHYAWEYEKLLAHRRHHELRLLEIGVKKGASLRMWAEYLPHARIVGVDIDMACTKYATDRIRIVIGDQAIPTVLGGALLELGPPDVIVDDGSHRLVDQRASWEFLFPYLADGGFYAIEDLQASPASVRWLEGLDEPVEFFCDRKLAIMRR